MHILFSNMAQQSELDTKNAAQLRLTEDNPSASVQNIADSRDIEKHRVSSHIQKARVTKSFELQYKITDFISGLDGKRPSPLQCTCHQL